MLKSQNLKQRVFAIVISLLMAIGITASAGPAVLFANAATGDIVGVGDTEYAELTITNGGTDSATVGEDVREGQYFLYAKVTDPLFTGPQTEGYYSISLQVTAGSGEEAYTEYLTYNDMLGMYFANLSAVAPGEELVFRADYPESVHTGAITVQAYLGGLALGEFNDYDLGNVTLPADVELQISAGEHLISVSPYIYEEVEGFDPTYTVEVNGAAVTLAPDSDSGYTYTGVITVGGTTTVTISGENAGDYPVDVRIYNYVAPTELELDEAIEMTYGEVNFYSLRATATGFQKFTATAVAENEAGEEVAVDAIFSLASKSSATAITSTNYPQLDYPVYLEEGHTYYFEISYAGISGADIDDPAAGQTIPDTVKATFSLGMWEGVDVVRDEILYIPVSPTERYTASVSGFSGAYDISVAVFPEDFDFAADALALHVIKGETEETYTLQLEADAETGISGDFRATVDLESATGLYVTWRENAVVGLVVEYTPIVGEITVGTALTITMPAGRNGQYYIYSGLTAGQTYQITLTGGNGRIEISSPNGVAVPEGRNFGLFTVDYPDYFFLTVQNYDETAPATVTVTVEEANVTDTLTLNTATAVDLSGGQSRAYSIDLEDGVYVLHIGGGNGKVYARTSDGAIVDEGNQNRSGYLYVSIYDTETTTKTVNIIFDNADAAATQVTVVVTKFGGGLPLNAENEITLSAEAPYIAYSMDLEAGDYYISLSGELSVKITYGDTVIVESDVGYGEFTVSGETGSSTEVILLFYYSGNAEIHFSAFISTLS